MRLTVKQLREEVQKAGGKKVAASDAYMKKEAIRQKLQDLIAGMVAAGEVRDQAGLEEAFQTLDMSLKALKMVPFNAWQQTSAGPVKRPARRR
mgnify:CR=1 FL=1